MCTDKENSVLLLPNLLKLRGYLSPDVSVKYEIQTEKKKYCENNSHAVQKFHPSCFLIFLQVRNGRNNQTMICDIIFLCSFL